MTFAQVARRYYHLNRAAPRVVDKLDMAVSRSNSGSTVSFWPVAPWNRFLRLNEKTSNFHYPDPAWSYSQEDGVLVYPAATHAPGDCGGHVYHIVDLSSGQRVPVPFDVRSKHVRRARLAQGVLIIEWAEALPYHQLNDREVVHRHFVSAFDVIRCPARPGWTWSVQFRSEWKLHFLGLPLNNSDRFFSAHTATHYAVYFWQPNRSLYQDDPIEQLAVWDISSPSPYRPSEDPGKRPNFSRAPSLPAGLWNGQNSAASGRTHGPPGPGADLLERRPRRASLAAATAGPQVIRRMAWRELDFYGLRQRATPQLRCLSLDDRNLYVIEEEHRWADGQHSSLNPPRVHLVKSTGIPIIPMPTASCPTSSYPAAARSTSDLNTQVDLLVDPKPAALSTIIEGPVHGPIWVDACGADGDVHMNFCRRVAGPNANAESAVAGIWPPSPTGAANAASQGQENPAARSGTRSPTTTTGWPWTLDASVFPHNGPSAESARWPGWAPCWRHEDFPYLTVAEMVDFAAGVRVTARHCFMLETLSVHVRPAVAVKGIAAADRGSDDAAGGGRASVDARTGSDKPGTGRRRGSSTSGKGGSRRCEEVQFPDEMWSELVASGHIAGDERWIVGEDEKGRITIVRF